MKKLLTYFLSILLVVTFFSTTSFAAEISNTRDEVIDELRAQKLKCILREEYDEIEKIDEQLEKLGVKKITSIEAQQLMNKNGDYSVMVTPPSTTNVDWSVSTSNYTVGYKTYTVQTLTAEPNLKNSSLYKDGSKTIGSEKTWQASSLNILSSTASSTVGSIPAATKLFTLFDIADGIVSGLSETTSIEDIEVTYVYTHLTTATFKYVKEKTDSDDEYTLCLTSTMGETFVDYNCPFRYYYNGQLKAPVLSDAIEISSKPSNYNSASLAIAVFKGTTTTRTAFVTSVTLKGPENKPVAYIYPTCPDFPSQIS